MSKKPEQIEPKRYFELSAEDVTQTSVLMNTDFSHQQGLSTRRPQAQVGPVSAEAAIRFSGGDFHHSYAQGLSYGGLHAEESYSASSGISDVREERRKTWQIGDKAKGSQSTTSTASRSGIDLSSLSSTNFVGFSSRRQTDLKVSADEGAQFHEKFEVGFHGKHTGYDVSISTEHMRRACCASTQSFSAEAPTHAKWVLNGIWWGLKHLGKVLKPLGHVIGHVVSNALKL